MQLHKRKYVSSSNLERVEAITNTLGSLHRYNHSRDSTSNPGIVLAFTCNQALYLIGASCVLIVFFFSSSSGFQHRCPRMLDQYQQPQDFLLFLLWIFQYLNFQEWKILALLTCNEMWSRKNIIMYTTT